MTQAFNLSQLANFVNTSGQLNAATALFNQTPVANGGTGLSTVTSGALLLGAGTSAMTELTGTTPGTTIVSSPTGWISSPTAAVGGGDYVMRAYASPATWTKPGTLKAIKVTVVGAGGNGGTAAVTPAAQWGAASGGGGGGAAILYLDAPAIPGPVAVTAGAGTNSFGAFCSATAGAAGSGRVASAAGVNGGGAGGAGSGGTINVNGNAGQSSFTISTAASGGAGGGSILGGGGGTTTTTTPGGSPGLPGQNYGGGGGGGTKVSTTPAISGGTGAPGVIIVEEFY